MQRTGTPKNGDQGTALQRFQFRSATQEQHLCAASSGQLCRPSLIQERQQLFFTTNLALYGDHSCSIILQLAMYVVDMMDGFCPI